MVAAFTAAAAIVLGGVVLPLGLALFAVALPALAARVTSQLGRVTLLLSLPLGLSALLVNVFFFPGGREVIVAIGPISATAEGLAFALEIVVRILVISGAITLFYLTTKPAELVLDLERRGVSPRLAFVTHATVSAVPAMAERAEAIVAAQRARGLDTEGGVLKRLRGIVPLTGPVVLGTLAEVEERSIALEARAFTRPGRRSLLWQPPDTNAERVLRWTLPAVLLVLIVLRSGGWLP